MSLYYYYRLLSEKREQLSRLHTCNSQLQVKRNEFNSNRSLIVNPELSSFTWEGSLARKFNDIRHDGMLHYYTDIKTNQLGEVFSSLDSKIQSIREEIRSINQTIAYLEQQLAEENANN
ncbi:YwqH-like family protein [Aquibacillus rhizosphaerae]|uniref:DUF5082 family protein n=1 Tax=Aquibacillus rhizosphaerae TaxID=3051431 RepID=A0ABT7L9W5_9BACI|nr:DUF5082 family protein [Aquibacillus sp. LR5S19]MDL4842649.1 DUF5082 family protein [Aquibacillus sp. LR5S19]